MSGLGQQAIAGGVRPATVARALSDVRQLDTVIRNDRNQPEFVATFADYFARRVTPERIANGRRLLAEHNELLRRLTAQYGVPGQYLIALWGLETNFGSVLGTIRVFDSLATLACDERRGEYFGGELIDALKIVDGGELEPTNMIGSWAGAIGHTQFMPSAYLTYAVDGDADGRIDLAGSARDALASGANYLRALGWLTGLRWGREVLLPEEFDYAGAGLDRSRPLREWRELGLRDTDGGALVPLDLDAAVLVPSGHAGPAFLVYANFRALMRWNRSEYFALVVGHLADRIAGAGELRKPIPDGLPVTREQLIRLQELLNARGYDSGNADGIPGSATRAAVRDYEQDHGMIPDGYVDAELLQALGIF